MTVSTRLLTVRPALAPDQVSGLSVWLKADALALTDNDPVGTWADSSGNTRTATGTGTARPLFKTNILNGLPVVRFDGVNDIMLCVAFASPIGPVTTRIAVFDVTPTSGDTHLISSGTADRQDLVLWTAGGQFYLYGGSSSGAGGSIGLLSVVTGAFNGASSFIRQNGVQVATGNVGSNTWGQMSVGGFGQGLSAFTQVDLAEVAVWNRALTAFEIQAVERHLGRKYGIGVT